jgi:outer membrane receptor protein involved in Fe transport
MPDQLERVGALAYTCTCVLQRLFGCGYFLAICALVAGFGIATAYADDRKPFNIDAGPAAESLNEYARQANVELGFSVDNIGAIRTNAVKGRYVAGKALSMLLEDTGLAAKNNDGGILIYFATALGADSASAGDAGFPGAGHSDEQPAPGKSNRHAETAESDGAKNFLEEIIVTGSNIRGAGTIGASAVSFDREELAKTGYSTVEDLFQSLPQNLDEITPIGAIATGASILAGFNAQGVTAINLRGLGPGSTLVLLNGKRRPGNINGRAVDVSAIPLAMVERVDVVTGGYSAIYGSDAVAGVVNLITRKSFDGAESQLYYGESSSGGERFNLSQTFGQEFDKGGFVFGYDYRNERPLDATETGVLRTPSREGVTPIPGLFHLRGAAEQHVGLFAGRFGPTDTVELYADAQIAVEDYENRFAYRIDSCCDIESNKVTDSKQYSAVLGSRFDFGRDWMVDISALYGMVDNTGDASSAVAVPSGTITSESPRPPVNSVDHDEAELTSFSAVADGPLHVFGDSPVSAAIGVDFRRESYLRQRTPLATGMAQAFENIDRDVRSIFGELHFPLRDDLKVSLAGRYDDYSDFGDTVNPQIGVEWRAARTLNLRGTFSQAFRAPDLFALALQTRVRIRSLADPLDATGGTTATVFIETGGNSGLQPEEADTYSLGIDWEPSDRTTLSLTYFNIRYDGRIDTPDPFGAGVSALENEHLYPNLIDRNPTPDRLASILDRVTLVINDSGVLFDPTTDDPFATFPNIVIFDNRSNNIAREAMDGFDVEASAAWETPSGNWSVGLNGTYYLDFERNITATSPAINQLNQPGRPVDLKLRGHFGWAGEAWNARLYVNYVDSYYDNIADPAIPIESWTTADLTLGLEPSTFSDSSFLRGLRATFGILNLFDEKPPVLLNDGFGLGYDAINANAVGRYVSLRVSKRW